MHNQKTHTHTHTHTERFELECPLSSVTSRVAEGRGGSLPNNNATHGGEARRGAGGLRRRWAGLLLEEVVLKKTGDHWES